MAAPVNRLMLRQARNFGGRSGQRYASTTSQAADAVSSTATKSKEAASNATSKASQGLSRVTSSAGPALNGAVQGVSNALGRIGGRTGKLITFVEWSHPVPSAADSGHIERYPAANIDHERPARISRKRKRATVSESIASDNSQRQDPHSRAENGSGSISTKRTDASAKTLVLDQEQCKRILKQNRLKVTLLQSTSGNGEQHERHQCLSRKNGAASGTKGALSQLVTEPLQSFDELVTRFGVSKRLANNLALQGYSSPTEVQLGTLPILLGDDRSRGLQLDDREAPNINSLSEVDLLTAAPTGSGKTLAFLVHLLHGLRQRQQNHNEHTSSKPAAQPPQALILAPTHELVDQIVNEGKKLAFGTGIRISRLRKDTRLGKGSSTENNISDKMISGSSDDGILRDEPSDKSATKANILVGTPMLMSRNAVPSTDGARSPMADVQCLVLDEADVLLDPLFREQTLAVWGACTNPNLQTSLWSATIGSSIEALAQTFISERRARLGLTDIPKKYHTIRVVVGLKDSAVPNISHQLVYTATEPGKLMALRQMIHPTAGIGSNTPSLQPPFLVFTQSIPRAIALHAELLYDVPPEAGGSSRIAVLHSDLSDTARSAVMTAFRKGEVWILITTDLLARGIDFRGINGVVNYDIPNTSGLYVHRVGRTGRQGRKGGVAVTLYTKEDIKYVKNVANVIAASEKQKATLADGKGQEGAQRWLLDALPDVSKKSKEELKRHGVEGRRPNTNAGDSGREARQMRISTKSGYDRRLENRRKGAVASTQFSSAMDGSDDEWEGIQN
ncbi:MAG: hypothetical protein Q9220_005605 [cf. Caloplaca sp. 1 TL-2023]